MPLDETHVQEEVRTPLAGEKRTHDGRPKVSKEGADPKESSEGSEEEGDRPLPKELTSLFEPLECKLCNVVVDSPITALTHYKGKLHQKKINAFMAKHYNTVPVFKKPKPAFLSTCEVCSVKLTSKIQAQQHMSGKTHMKNMRKPKTDNFVSVPKVAEDPSGRFGIGVAFMPSPTEPQVVESEYLCTLCNVVTTSADQLEAHKKGSKHAKKLKKEPVTENNTPKDLSMFRTPSDLYYCPKCNLSTNSAEQFLQHTESKKHKKYFRPKEISKSEL